MDYKEAVEYLETPRFQGSRPGLESMAALLEELGDPQRGMEYVHIAGTNGKGSTASFIERILRESGYRTGLYTSPYIQRFTERIRVNGAEIAEEAVVRLTERLAEATSRLRRKEIVPTVFELFTAMALLYYKEQQCDVVVLEAGIGGRLDATNIISRTAVSVITTIDYDHMNVLGDSLEKIAWEKAGIVKDNGLVVMYPQREVVDRVIADVCRQKKAGLVTVDFTALNVSEMGLAGQKFHFKGYGNLEIRLLGTHQIKNAAVAVTAAEELIKRGWHISNQNIRAGLLGARWPGRLEIVHRDPVVVIDGAHNPQGVRVLTESLARLFPGRRITFIVGIMADKDYETMTETVLPLAEKFVTVMPHSSRALASGKLADILRKKGCSAISCTTVREAVDLAMELSREENGEEGVVCAFGSLYYIGDVRDYLMKDEDGGMDHDPYMGGSRQ